jgi:hypothetical protein
LKLAKLSLSTRRRLTAPATRSNRPFGLFPESAAPTGRAA